MKLKISIIAMITLFFSFCLNAADNVSIQIEDSEILVTLEIPPNMHQTYQEGMLYVDPEPIEGIEFSPVVFPDGIEEHGSINYYDQVVMRLPFQIEASVDSKKINAKIYVGYQFCDEEGVCHFPEEEMLVVNLLEDGKSKSAAEIEKEISATNDQGRTDFSVLKTELDKFEIADKAAGYLKSKDFIDFVEKATSTDGSSTDGFAGKSIWLILLLIIIGGIALNLTPCVLPMMPITVAVLGAGTQAESKGKGFLIGGLYGLGMTLAYGALGLIVVLTGSQFGVINSSPWFNLVIAIVFVFLSLAMFDIIPIDFSHFQSGKIPGKKSGKVKYITVFVLGVIAAVLAGACVAPVLISVILYSVTLYNAGNSAGLLLPFLLGLGMALPWPFVGAGLSFLPKPGNWMKWVKIIFGVVILVIALYYGWTAYHIFASSSENIEHSEENSASDLQWHKSLLKGLQTAEKENKPVLIDFWATWCKNCLAMDATTFKDPEVQRTLQDFVLIKHQAEDLKVSPHKELMEYFGILGLPTYIILHPKDLE